MKPPVFMLIAGEASGDLLAAELVRSLKEQVKGAQFFGAGGSQMQAAGVELAINLTQHAVIGIWEAIKTVPKFQRILNDLVQLACQRRPDVIICVDFSGFNRRFATAVRQRLQSDATLAGWKPKIVQYVSPQVWASRPGRARKLAQAVDLLLCTFPFEKDWYAQRVPELKVEFVGNPIVDRYGKEEGRKKKEESANASPLVLLLPGSRKAEVRRHLPVMFDALRRMQVAKPGLRAKMVLPSDELQSLVAAATTPKGLEVQVGGLEEAMREADVAITKSGTVTLELAFFGVPSVVFYKTSWITYFIGRLAISVEYIAMPNLLANEPLFPEFIQHTATGENLSRESLELLDNTARRKQVQDKLNRVVAGLGEPGASQRAAQAVVRLLSAGG